MKAALLGRSRRDDDDQPDASVTPLLPPPGPGVPPGAYGPVGYSAAWSGRPSRPLEPPAPAPLDFPRGSGTTFTIGRTQDCDLRISDLSVSRRHAELTRGEDGWLLSDLGSHNGTRINGWLVREPVPLRPGDTVQFGSAMFVVQADQGQGGLGGREAPPSAGGSGGSSPRASTDPGGSSPRG